MRVWLCAAMSVKAVGEVTHFLIEPTRDDQYKIKDAQFSFPSLEDLIEYHSRQADGVVVLSYILVCLLAYLLLIAGLPCQLRIDHSFILTKRCRQFTALLNETAPKPAAPRKLDTSSRGRDSLTQVQSEYRGVTFVRESLDGKHSGTAPQEAAEAAPPSSLRTAPSTSSVLYPKIPAAGVGAPTRTTTGAGAQPVIPTDLRKQPWFFANCSRDGAERLLTAQGLTEGMFLVRPSSS
jgi:hypothetical protein